MQVREKSWPAFPTLVGVVRKKGYVYEEPPGQTSERSPGRQGCENAMKVALKTGLLSESKLYVRFGVSSRLVRV